MPNVLLAQPGRSPPGAGAAVNAPVDAPRVAYLLTAAMADNTEQVGAIVPGDDMSTEWGGYDESAQHDILAALGEQTREALKMLHDKLGVEIEMDWHSTAQVVCSEALATARELVRPEPEAWTLPECAHCRDVIVKAMCSLQIQAYFRLGFTPAKIATMCRQSTDEPQASPHP
jgi:hypothetical protein